MHAIRIFILGLLMSAPLTAAGQVMIAPTLIYMDSREPYGTFTVINRSDVPQEVGLDFEFGYPISDAEGNRSFEFGDSLAEASHGLGERIRAFPKRFVLEPGKRQAVRLMVRMPTSAPDGVYWTRLATTSSDTAPSMNRATGVVEARINLAVRQLIPVVFRNGNVSHSMDLKDLRADVDRQRVRILAKVERKGDAPFLGTATVRIYDRRGRQVKKIEERADVYFTFTVRLEFDRSDLPPGRYTAQLTFEPRLRDVPSYRLPVLEPVSGQISFHLTEK